MKRAFVTGGCGFVGRHFCKRLIDLGYFVVCVDNMTSESAMHPDDWPTHLYVNNSNNFIFFDMDCIDLLTTDVPFFGEEPYWDIIIHLAAVVGGRTKIEGEPLQVAQDLSIDANFFSAITKLKRKPGLVVYFSSSAAYPVAYQTEDNQCILKEDMMDLAGDKLGLPDLSYGWAKLSGEYLASLVRDKYDIPIAIYRPFSGFGEDQDTCYPFMNIFNKIYRNDSEIEIWSDSVRDFVYIEDIIDCVMTTAPAVAKDKTVLNIASGRATSFSELVRIMSKCVNGHENINIRVAEDKPKGVYYRVGCPEKAKRYGWIPQTPLELALRIIKMRYNCRFIA